MPLQKEPAPNNEHIIQGFWATKEIHIDGEPVTVPMLNASLAGVIRLHHDTTFGWGPGTNRWPLILACCEFAVPKMWTLEVYSHAACVEFFKRKLAKLPAGDFVLRYTNNELRNAMQRIQRRRSRKYDQTFEKKQ